MQGAAYKMCIVINTLILESLLKYVIAVSASAKKKHHSTFFGRSVSFFPAYFHPKPFLHELEL